MLVSAAIRDVTERKRAEVALRESEQRRDLALESARMGSWDLDIANDVSVRSQRHNQIFGYETAPEEWGIEIMMSHVVPDQREIVRQALAGAVTEGHLSLQCQIRWPDGSLHWIDSEGVVFRDEQGKAVRMLGIVTDVTERKRLEDELQTALHRAIEASQLKSQFLANMSHEIRTPMNGVLGIAHLLLDTDLDVIQRRFTLALRDSGQNLLAIINDILDFSKVEAGRLELEQIDFDLRPPLAPRVRPTCWSRPHERASTFALDVLTRRRRAGSVRRPRSASGRWSPTCADNAVKFTDAGSVTLRVRRHGGARVRFEVTDTGIGIASESRGNLLDPFTRRMPRPPAGSGGPGSAWRSPDDSST